MAKYRVTEAQLQKIFESLEMKRLSEYDNWNYPEGADADPNAPWNQSEPNYKDAKDVNGNYIKVAAERGEYLLKNKENNQLFYTIDDVFDEFTGGRYHDIKDALYDYLNIAQEKEADEDGYYSVDADDWKDYIDSDDISYALESYMNDIAKSGETLEVVDAEKWKDGEGKFLLVTPESVGEIMSEKLKAEANKQLGLN
jgi:hypothetical protein